MMQPEDVERGDPVEVKCVRDPVPGDQPREFWRRATVVASYTHQIAVEFEDGQRMALQWRHVRRIGGR